MSWSGSCAARLAGLEILHAARDGGPARRETSGPVSRQRDRVFAQASVRKPAACGRVRRTGEPSWNGAVPGGGRRVDRGSPRLCRVMVACSAGAAGRAIGLLVPSGLRPLPSHTWKGPLPWPLSGRLPASSWIDTPSPCAGILSGSALRSISSSLFGGGSGGERQPSRRRNSHLAAIRSLPIVTTVKDNWVISGTKAG